MKHTFSPLLISLLVASFNPVQASDPAQPGASQIIMERPQRLADGTLFVSNRGPNTISAWQRSGPTRHFLCEWPTGDWPRALCAVPGTLYLLAACQREGAVHCYYCSSLPRRAPTETASLALPGASCALVLD